MASCAFCADPVGAKDLLPVGQNNCPICGNPIPSVATEEPSGAYQAGPPRATERRRSPGSAAEETRTPKPHAPESPRRGSVLVQVRQLDIGTAAAFACGSVALLLASFPNLTFLTKPLSGVGLLLGVLAGVVPALRKHKNPALPGVISAFCLTLLLLAGSWPSFQGPSPPLLMAITLHEGGMVAPRAIVDDEWVDASKTAVQTENLMVEVVSARVGAVALKSDDKRFSSPDKHLMIRLRVQYKGIDFREVPYESWAERAGAPSKHPPVLVDNAERLYAQVPFDASSEVVGRWTAPTLLPGRAAGEFLVFTAPPAGIEYLRLKLPASALGGTSEFRFQVPKSMIEGL